MSRKTPGLTQIAEAVQNGGGYTLATRSGKRKRICQRRTGVLVQLLADAVQSGPTAWSGCQTASRHPRRFFSRQHHEEANSLASRRLSAVSAASFRVEQRFVPDCGPLLLEEINDFCGGSMRLGGQTPSVSSSGRETLFDLIGKPNCCQKVLSIVSLTFTSDKRIYLTFKNKLHAAW